MSVETIQWSHFCSRVWQPGGTTVPSLCRNRPGFISPYGRRQIAAMPRTPQTCDLSLPDASEILAQRDTFMTVALGDKASSVSEIFEAGADADDRYPIPDIGRYGSYWHYDKRENYICCDRGFGHYEIELDRTDLDTFPMHLAEKVWVTPELVGQMIYLLKEVFGRHNWSPIVKIQAARRG